MLRFMSLSSGSCGNCYYLSTGEHGLLIDAGVAFRRLRKVFTLNSISPDSIDAILVTHDHLDHVRHLGPYCEHLHKPVYTTDMLRRALLRQGSMAECLPSCSRIIEEGEWTDLGFASVKTFVVPHDATQTLGYAIVIGGHRFVIMTDLGRMTEEALELASEADTVVIESNYDMDMLMGGRYTYELKMRIVQGNGHLSNDECAAAIARFWHPGLRNIFLCHLSENNNTPDLAFRAASEALDKIGVEKGSVSLRCLPRRVQSPMFILQAD